MEGRMYRHRSIASYNGNEPYIFISYSHSYRSLVRHMVEMLNEMGYRVSNDGGNGQLNMSEQYYKLVENCSVYVMILSPRTAVSQRVRNEVRHISKNSIVLLLEKKQTALDPEFSYYLSSGTVIKANRKLGKDTEKLADYMVKKLVPYLPEDLLSGTSV